MNIFMNILLVWSIIVVSFFLGSIIDIIFSHLYSKKNEAKLKKMMGLK